ncbi:MAG TPA: hypothetical protein VF427_06185 [Noviherbaspirillum sp.]
MMENTSKKESEGQTEKKTDFGRLLASVGIPAIIGSTLTAATYLTGVAFQQACCGS